MSLLDIVKRGPSGHAERNARLARVEAESDARRAADARKAKLALEAIEIAHADRVATAKKACVAAFENASIGLAQDVHAAFLEAVSRSEGRGVALAAAVRVFEDRALHDLGEPLDTDARIVLAFATLHGLTAKVGAPRRASLRKTDTAEFIVDARNSAPAVAIEAAFQRMEVAVARDLAERPGEDVEALEILRGHVASAPRAAALQALRARREGAKRAELLERETARLRAPFDPSKVPGAAPGLPASGKTIRDAQKRHAKRAAELGGVIEPGARGE